MDFINEKIRVMIEKLKEFSVVQQKNIEYTYIECPDYKINNNPPILNDEWKPYDSKIVFDGIDQHYWLHLQIKAVTPEDEQELRLSVKTGREGEWDPTNPQFTVFVNGVTTQALDTNHTWLPLEYGQDYDIYLYLYTGMVGGHFEVQTSLLTVDLRVEALFYDILIPYEAMQEMDPASYDYIKIRDCMDKALLNLDLRHIYSEDFYHSVDRTLDYLKNEFYEKICGNSESIVSCIGHTHIDVAWLWTVAQTKEKAQRSFSTVINLLKRYKDYIFMSSQPQLYQFVKECDPELYKKIKDAVKDGKWEPEGAMWLESDTNLVSGESLIRQILYGKRFLKEEFGIESKILWLPDVFGYTGALPQIMKKCGINQFFTSKLSSCESNTLPNDTFIWEGIDGSKVFASFIQDYVCRMNAHTIKRTWDNYKNKSYTNNTLVTFGFGDGGGGTTYEMMEHYERLKYGIPGIPKTRIEKVADFFERIEKDFTENAKALKKEPRWKGELYYERHRGTYTSIGKNKRNNRKSELLYQKAETLAVTDLVLNTGEYPSETIHRNTINILLNQFHDIIPGSSIREVYEVTDQEYSRILCDGQSIVDEKLHNIIQNLDTQGGIFVYNPTPFNIDRYITLEGKSYYAENIPAHGWKVIDRIPIDNNIAVTENSIENDKIKIIFNNKYHVVSLFDKEEQRELIPEGEEAGCLEIYEDYPRDYDAWELTNYYKQKMWLADNVDHVELLENGIRICRKYQNSIIRQEIVLAKGSKRVDFITEVDWQEDHVLLKAAFPVDIHNTKAVYDIQFGNLERPTHRNTSWEEAKFEVSAHKWADLSEGGYGVSLLNDCKYGYSIEDNVMRLSLLKAPSWPNPEADREIHHFTYSLYPHKGNFKEGNTIMEGYLLNCPLDAFYVEKTNGSLSNNFSFISCPQKNIIIETIKKAEDDDSIIVRLYDSYNQKTRATLQTGFDYKEVFLCDMLENNLEKLQSDSGCVTVLVKNYEVITLKFVR